MLLQNAELAMAIAPQIRTVMAEMDAINDLKTKGDTIVSGKLVTASGVQREVYPLSVTESIIVFNAMLQILQARLDALNAQLAAL